MCGCVEYEDNSMFLCPVCADIARDNAKKVAKYEGPDVVRVEGYINPDGWQWYEDGERNALAVFQDGQGGEDPATALIIPGHESEGKEK